VRAFEERNYIGTTAAEQRLEDESNVVQILVRKTSPTIMNQR